MPTPEGETMRLSKSNQGCPAAQGSLALPSLFFPGFMAVSSVRQCTHGSPAWTRCFAFQDPCVLKQVRLKKHFLQNELPTRDPEAAARMPGTNQ